MSHNESFFSNISTVKIVPKFFSDNVYQCYGFSNTLHNVFISLDTLQSVDELTAEASLSSRVLRSALHSETKLPKVTDIFSLNCLSIFILL